MKITDTQIAINFDIPIRTLQRWKQKFPKLYNVIKKMHCFDKFIEAYENHPKNCCYHNGKRVK